MSEQAKHHSNYTVSNYKGEYMKKCVFSLNLFLIITISNVILYGSATNDIKLFTQGKRVTYSTKNNPKAKGLEISLEYPISWKAEEGQRPNIVQKFTGFDDLNNLVQVILSIKDIPLNEKKPHNEREILNTIKNMVNTSGGSCLEIGSTKIENEDAYWVIYNLITERANLRLRAKIMMYIFLYDNKYIQFQCIIGGITSDPTIDQRFIDYMPVFQLIMNSIIFTDKWR